MRYKISVDNLIYIIKRPYVILRNWILSKRYPWLIPWAGWADNEEVYDYSVTKYLMWDPDSSWGRAFFYLMMEDIRRVAKRNKIINKLHTVEQKEKWGELVFDISGGNKEIEEIVDAYTTLSSNICIFCGRPDVGRYKSGWILPVCPKCFKKTAKSRNNLYDDLMSQDRRMSNWFEYKRWNEDKNQWTHYKIDIKPTANRIRKRWNIHHPFRRTPYA